MFPVRRAALRFLSAPSVSFTARSRTISSFTSSTLRVQRHTPLSLFQKRWASDATAKDEAPISHLQPTPQEEVENAIAEDNAAGTVESSIEASSQANETSANNATPIAETANSTEATEEVLADAAPQDSFVSGGFSRDSRPPALPKPTLYIGNLFFDVTKDDLQRELSRFGELKDIRIIRDARGLSKGFGYVTFGSTEEATKAKDALHNQVFEGRRMVVSYAHSERSETSIRRDRDQNRSLNPPSKTLFIGNMSWDMTDRDLNTLFRDIKGVVDVRVAIDRRTGQPRGFAHADFTDVKSAMAGLQELSAKEVHGRKLRVDYSFGASTSPRNQVTDEDSL